MPSAIQKTAAEAWWLGCYSRQELPRLVLIVTALISVNRAAGNERSPVRFPVWEGKPPGYAPAGPPRETLPPPEARQVPLITGVAEPFVRWFPAHRNSQEALSTAVVVLPGGGFHVLAAEHEGVAVARWLNGIGVDAFVLHYRVPTGGHDPPWEPGFADLRQTLRGVRQRHREYGVDPQRVGVLGFSAGGHLAARAAMHQSNEKGSPDANPTRVRPSFSILIYPYRIVRDDEPGLLRNGLEITADTPPMFLVHAADDEVPIANSATLFQRAVAQGVSAELHAFGAGGHGFGLLTDSAVGRAWPTLCEEWMAAQGLLDNAHAAGD